jgi:hypothetical protein
VGELKAQGQEKGHHAFDKGLAIAQELQVGRFVVKINGDGAVVPYPFARLSHVSPLWHQVLYADETQWGEHIEISRPS